MRARGKQLIEETDNLQATIEEKPQLHRHTQPWLHGIDINVDR